METLEIENKELRREVDDLKKRVKEGWGDGIPQELVNKLRVLESENGLLTKENEVLRNKIEKINLSLQNAKEDELEVRKKYEDLKLRIKVEGITPSKSSSRFATLMDYTPGSDSHRIGRSISSNKKFL
jgi:hypothetical protein